MVTAHMPTRSIAQHQNHTATPAPARLPLPPLPSRSRLPPYLRGAGAGGETLTLALVAARYRTARRSPRQQRRRPPLRFAPCRPPLLASNRLLLRRDSRRFSFLFLPRFGDLVILEGFALTLQPPIRSILYANKEVTFRGFCVVSKIWGFCAETFRLFI